MTSPEIKTLIKFLQNNGGSVISGHNKFLVTPSILKEINTILHTVKEDIYVSSLTNSDLINKYSSKNELMFLYDFVKKTPKLKISNTVSSHDFYVDVSDFTNLKYLELYKFNVKHLKGIQFLRENLEMVVCLRSMDKIGNLLLNTESEDNIWSKLRHAILSRNNIYELDESFIYTPWLQYLDISYNQLTDLRQLTCLLNLTHLNASYNNLKEVPKLAVYKLKVLLISNNYISDISGISKLINLQECDLSGNCIAEHADLFPLADLPSLLSLNIAKNPICYHPLHRSLTCGYLHENVADQYFLLDGSPLIGPEKEFIRRCSRKNFNIYGSNRTSCSSSTSYEDNFKKDHMVVKTKISKKVREAIIADQQFSDTENNKNNKIENLMLTEEEDLNKGKHLQVKKQIETLRAQYGEEGWLHGNAASEVQNLLNIENLQHVSPSNSDGIPISAIFNAKISISSETLSTHKNNDINSTQTSSTNEDENNYDQTLSNDSGSSSETEESDEDNYSEDILWLVKKVHASSSETIFLILGDTELKEKDVSTNKLITRWSLDAIERYIKISSDPFTLHIIFDVMRRNDRNRKYIMEYADAQKLIARIEKKLERKTLNEINQKLLHCIKCNSFFCQEIQRRKPKENEISYKCTTCGSDAVIEEDESVLPNKNNVNYSSSLEKKTQTEFKTLKVTQSPSESSIGSAASLDQNVETTNNADSTVGFHESDIEIISNPSQSSIEVLEVHSGDSIKTVLRKFSERHLLYDTYTATHSQLLTESSSSGSMTDSICTSYEPSQLIRSPHRISQSTVDEVLLEESGNEISLEQSRNEEKNIEMNTKNIDNKKSKIDFSSVLGDVLQTVTSKIIIASTPPRNSIMMEFDSSLTKYEYSYTNFTCIDHRIKLYIWDKVVPPNEEISAFIRVNAIYKSGTSTHPFPGVVVLTNKKIYIIKITKEENDENPANWLQKNDSINTEKIKLFQPIIWKQGFSIIVDDRANSGNLKYLMLLYDTKRTDNFLSFMRDLGTIHIQKSDDFSEEKNLKTILQVDENIRNFSMSDLITIYKNDEEDKSYNYAGLIITDSYFIIIKGEMDWLLTDSSTKPSIVIKENMSNLIGLDETKSGISLQFLNEAERIDKIWDIKTVTPESNKCIFEAIRQPWEELFQVQLQFSRITN